MAKYRQGRINDEVLKELSVILRNIKDMKYAKVYFSFLRTDAREVLRGLKAAAGFIRRELARSLNLRMTPELSFYEDKSLANGAHISSLLNGLTYSDDDATAESDSESNADGTNQ